MRMGYRIPEKQKSRNPQADSTRTRYTYSMNIMIDIRLLARGETTGIPGYTRDLIKTLIQEFPEHHYTLFYSGLKPEPLPDLWLQNSNVTVVQKRIPNRLLDLSFRLFNAPGLEKFESASPPNVLFSPHFNLLPETETPRVITFHDLSFLHYPQFFSTEQKTWHALQHYREQATKAKRIIAVSEFTKNDLVSLLSVPSEKISVIYPGINPTFEHIPRTDGRLSAFRIEQKLNKPFILYLGSLEPRKNLPLLIKAFDIFRADARFQEYELILAGRDGFHASGLRRLARSLPSRDAIRFIGPVKDDERVLLYNCARSFVFPSWFEGFGFPPLEAQACGVPVLSSNRTSLAEILEQSAILFDPWNVSALADALIAIESDSKLRENVVRVGYENIKRFSWTIAAQKTLESFKQAL